MNNINALMKSPRRILLPVMPVTFLSFLDSLKIAWNSFQRLPYLGSALNSRPFVALTLVPYHDHDDGRGLSSIMEGR
jgi:hypothetical protein